MSIMVYSNEKLDLTFIFFIAGRNLVAYAFRLGNVFVLNFKIKTCNNYSKFLGTSFDFKLLCLSLL